MARGRLGSHCLGHAVFAGDRTAAIGRNPGDGGGFLGGPFARLADAVGAESWFRTCFLLSSGAVANSRGVGGAWHRCVSWPALAGGNSNSDQRAAHLVASQADRCRDYARLRRCVRRTVDVSTRPRHDAWPLAVAALAAVEMADDHPRGAANGSV